MRISITAVTLLLLVSYTLAQTPNTCGWCTNAKRFWDTSSRTCLTASGTNTVSDPLRCFQLGQYPSQHYYNYQFTNTNLTDLPAYQNELIFETDTQRELAVVVNNQMTYPMLARITCMSFSNTSILFYAALGSSNSTLQKIEASCGSAITVPVGSLLAASVTISQGTVALSLQAEVRDYTNVTCMYCQSLNKAYDKNSKTCVNIKTSNTVNDSLTCVKQGLQPKQTVDSFVDNTMKNYFPMEDNAITIYESTERDHHIDMQNQMDVPFYARAICQSNTKAFFFAAVGASLQTLDSSSQISYSCGSVITVPAGQTLFFSVVSPAQGRTAIALTLSLTNSQSYDSTKFTPNSCAWCVTTNQFWNTATKTCQSTTSANAVSDISNCLNKTDGTLLNGISMSYVFANNSVYDTTYVQQYNYKIQYIFPEDQPFFINSTAKDRSVYYKLQNTFNQTAYAYVFCNDNNFITVNTFSGSSVDTLQKTSYGCNTDIPIDAGKFAGISLVSTRGPAAGILTFSYFKTSQTLAQNSAFILSNFFSLMIISIFGLFMF